MEESRDTIDNIKNAETAINQAGTSPYLLHQHLWVPDECQGFGEASGDFGDNRLSGCRIRESGFCAL